MTLEEIKQKAETFFEWPSDDRSHVTYYSTMLFALHCVKDAEVNSASLNKKLDTSE